MLILVLFSIILTNQSCVVFNATNGQENVCSLHEVKMKKTIVGTRYGNDEGPQNDINSPNAKSKQRMGCVVPSWPVRRLAKIYYCKKCDINNKVN